MTHETPYGPSGDDQPFWDGAKEGRLSFQQCGNCAYVRWPAAGVCPECLSRDSEWIEVAGTGTLWSYVTYHRAYAGQWKDEVPYPVGLVQLDCGVQLLTRLVDVDLAAGPDNIGMPLSVQYREVGDAGVVPVFGPA